MGIRRLGVLRGAIAAAVQTTLYLCGPISNSRVTLVCTALHLHCIRYHVSFLPLLNIMGKKAAGVAGHTSSGPTKADAKKAEEKKKKELEALFNAVPKSSSKKTTAGCEKTNPTTTRRT